VSQLDALHSKNKKIDVLILQETWNLQHPELLNIPGFQKVIFKTRKNCNGGGVGFYVKNNLKYKIVNIPNMFQEKVFESLTIEVQINKKRFLLSSVYRPPNTLPNLTANEQFDIFNDRLLALLSFCNDQNNCSSYVFTDSNINLHKLNSDQKCIDYISNIIGAGFVQVITKSTRINERSFSLIDHILTNKPSTAYRAGTIVSDVSDHFFTFIELLAGGGMPNETMKTKRDMGAANVQRFRDGLRNTNWDNVIAENDVDTSFGIFWDSFKVLYDLCFPLVKIRTNKNIHRKNNFVTSGILTSRKQKNLLHKKMIADPSDLNTNNYKTYRNVFNRVVRASKKLYFEQSLEKAKKNPKKTWEILKEATGCSNQNQEIQDIVVDNIEINDKNLMANEFNKFFTSIGQEISDSVKETVVSPEDYLTTDDNVPQLEFCEITPTYFCDIVKNLQAKNSMDIDGVSTNLLKKICIEISAPLAHIFNKSVQSGCFPSKLKISRVVPIFKSGDPSNMTNYRPISLLSALSKVLEKIIATQLVNHLEINKLLYEHQYGFQRNKSTEHNLLHVIEFVHSALNRGEFAIGVFLDLKKAFDVVSHEILLKKLKSLGIRDTPLKWFSSYLNNRMQLVDLGGSKSELRNLNISVLQGSVLGPILFLCFVNDLWRVTDLFTLLFADDTAAFKSGKNLNDLINKVNIELNKIAVWFRANKLAVNVSKTKYIIFRSKGKRLGGHPPVVFDANERGVPHDPALVYELERFHDQHQEPECRAYKLLGVYLDEHLTLDAHATHVRKKLARSLYCINRAKNFLTKRALKTLYFALIHSHLNYCPILFTTMSQKSKAGLFTAQKKAIRIITKNNYREHTAPLFEQENILSLDKIIELASLKFMHSIVYKYAPPSFNNMFSFRDQDGERPLRNDDMLTFNLPFPRTEMYKKSPVYFLSKLWNEADENKFNENKTTFIIATKSRLLLS